MSGKISPRTFVLNRKADISGVSGTGIVAEGMQFSDGQCVLRWFNYGTICLFKSLEDLITIHGHHGNTQVNFTDRPHTPSEAYTALSLSEADKCHALWQEHRKTCSHGGDVYTKMESGGGIGTVVKLVCGCGTELDVTGYSLW